MCKKQNVNPFWELLKIIAEKQEAFVNEKCKKTSNAMTDSSACCFGCGTIFKNKFACIVHQRSCDEI